MKVTIDIARLEVAKREALKDQRTRKQQLEFYVNQAIDKIKDKQK